MPIRIDTVLFDLGGTLFEHLPPELTERNLAVMHDLANERLGCATPAQPSVYHRVRSEVEADFAERGFFLHRELVAEAFRRYAQAIAEPDLVALCDEFCDRQRNTVIEQLRPRPDLHTTITALQKRGISLGIVSNIDDDVLGPLDERWQLSRWSRLMLSSERAGSCKPDSDVFQQALTELAARPENTLFVGDSLANDVVGAGALGMATALLLPAELKRGLPAGAERATVVIDRLSELLESTFEFVPNQRP